MELSCWKRAFFTLKWVTLQYYAKNSVINVWGVWTNTQWSKFVSQFCRRKRCIWQCRWADGQILTSLGLELGLTCWFWLGTWLHNKDMRLTCDLQNTSQLHKNIAIAGIIWTDCAWCARTPHPSSILIKWQINLEIVHVFSDEDHERWLIAWKKTCEQTLNKVCKWFFGLKNT